MIIIKKNVRRSMAAALALLQTGFLTSIASAQPMIAPAGPAPTVFFIHDVHAHPEAQMSIAALVDSLRRKAPVGFIALEGAFEKISVERLRNWERRAEAKSVAEFLVREKRISGPIEAAVTAETPLSPLYGVDDKALYDANVEAYRFAGPLADAHRRALSTTEAALETRISAQLSKPVSVLRQSIAARRAGTSPLDEHLSVLAKAGVTLSGSVKAYATLREAERSANPDALKRELVRLTAALSRRIEPRQRAELSRLSADAAQGDLKSFHRRLAALCAAAGIPLSTYPAIEAQARAADAAEALNIDRLETDLAELDATAVRNIALPAERALLDEDTFLALSRKLLSFSLTRTEWETYLVLRGRHAAVLANAAAFEKFYKMAVARDLALADRTLDLVRATNTGGILVAGGFHANGVAQRLRDAGVNVKLVYPTFAIDDISGGSDYLNRFNAPKPGVDPMLLTRADSLAPAPADGLGLAPFIGAVLGRAQGITEDGAAQRDFDALNGPSHVRARTSSSRPGIANGTFVSPRGSIDVELAVEPGTDGQAPRILRASFLETAPAAFAQLAGQAQTVASNAGTGLARSVLILGSTQRRPTVRAYARALPLILAVALVGCATPQPASVSLPYNSPAAFVAPSDTGSPANGWIAKFGDSRLESLVQEALRNNADLKVAAAKFEAAQAMYVGARSGLFPAVNANLGANHTSITDNQAREAQKFVPGQPYEPVNDQNLDPGSDRSMRHSEFLPSVSTSWELDVWGRVRAGSRAASADAGALAAAHQFARQSIAAQVARAYFVLTEAHLQSQRTATEVNRLNELLKLATAREEVGMGRRVEFVRVRAELRIAQERLRAYQSAEEKSARSLELLVGRYPGAEITATVSIPKSPKSVSAGLPSELLRRRWDIIAAEAELSARTHHVREAWASRFPRFTLNASAGATLGSAGLIDSGFSAGANILAPLLDWKKRLSAEVAASAEEREYVARYVAKVGRAFEEVETALGNARRLEQREEYIEAAVEDRKEELKLESARVELGAAPMEALIESQRRLTEAEAALVSIRSLRLQNLVTLYLSVGGDFSGASAREVSRPVAAPVEFRHTEPRQLPPLAPSEPASTNENFIPLPTGGAWFANPSYLRYAWLETPVVYIAAAIAYLGLAFLAPQIALAPALIGGALATAPVFFVAGHRLGNPSATFSKPVIALAAAKAGIAVLTAIAVAFAPTIGIAALVPVAGVSAVTLWHYAIQRSVVATRASLTSRTAAQAVRILVESPSDAAATAAAAAFAAVEGVPAISEPAIALAGRETAALGKNAPASGIQAALQSAVASSGREEAQPEPTGGLPQNHLSVIVIDRGAGPALRDHAISRAIEESNRGDRQVVVVVDGGSTIGDIQSRLTGLPRVSVAIAAAAFQQDGLELAALNDYLKARGFFDANPAVNLLARADLPIIPDGLDPTSVLARALILLLNRDLQAVAISIGGLSKLADIARLVAQQA